MKIRRHADGAGQPWRIGEPVRSIKLFASRAVNESNGPATVVNVPREVEFDRRRTMMANQEWMMAGVYLLGLVSTALLMSACSARAARMRSVVSRVSPRARTRD